MKSLVLEKLYGDNAMSFEPIDDDFNQDIELLEDSSDAITLSLYARVSTTKQEQKSAVVAQESNLEFWLEEQCKKHKNWIKGKTYVDTKTGRNFNRVAYQRMIEDAKRKKMNYIIFWDASRFGRNLSEVIRQCIKLKDDYGVDLYFVDEGIDTRAADGLARLLDRARIVDGQSRDTRNRVRRGMREKKRVLEKQGDGYLFTHRVLGLESRVGYKQQLFKVPEEVETLNLMANYYMECQSLTKTAEYLMSKGRKTVSGGTYWDVSTISRTLRNPIYTCVEEQGKTKIATLEDYYNVTRTHIPKKDRKPRFMPDRIERIWEDKFFLELQDILNKNSRKPWRNTETAEVKNHRYSGLLWCDCGGRMNIHSGSLEYGKNYYECHYKKHRGSKKYIELTGQNEADICESNVVYDWKLDLMFSQILKELKINKASLLKKAENVLKSCLNTESSSEDILKEQKKINSEIKKNKDVMRKHRERMMNEIITEEEYLYDTKPLKSNIESLEKKYSKLEEDLKKIENFNIESIVTDYMKTLEEIFDGVEDEMVYHLVEMVIQKGENEFIWYLNLGDELDSIAVPEEYRVIHKRRLPLRVVEVVKDSRRKLTNFEVSEFTARAYKKDKGLNSLKKYEPLKVSVYY